MDLELRPAIIPSSWTPDSVLNRKKIQGENKQALLYAPKIRILIGGATGMLHSRHLLLCCTLLWHSRLVVGEDRRREYQVDGPFSRRIPRTDPLNQPFAFLASTKRKSTKDDPPIAEEGSEKENPFWPPWPFSKLQRNPENSVTRNLFDFVGTSARVGGRNLQVVGSSLWFHLPPAAPPLLFYAAWPRSVEGRTVVPLFANPVVRTLVTTSVIGAIFSWAHTELYRHRQLTPILHADINRAVLPPFLPDAVPVHLEPSEMGPSTLTATIAKFWKNRRLQRAERHNAHRLAVYDTLRNRKNSPKSDKTDRYAVVTGASTGIGRALAVELARWKIPLILIARNLEKLQDLAYDLQTCYNIPVYVLSADLSQPSAAQAIHQCIRDANLPVDILVNNAGVNSYGESLDVPMEDLERMVQINSLSMMGLTQLFGNDMREQRRGRILQVSSICGGIAGIAGVAVYSATKAFENSYTNSIGKELEKFGVGVTCLIPGAVSGTDFRSSSRSSEALCWKIPFYPKSAPLVAECGVRAMLRGDTEVVPGVLNRVFLKVFKPIFPQRLHNWVSEIMWQPFYWPWQNAESNDLPQHIEFSAGSVRPKMKPGRVPKVLTLPRREEQPKPSVILLESTSDGGTDPPSEITIEKNEKAATDPSDLESATVDEETPAADPAPVPKQSPTAVPQVKAESIYCSPPPPPTRQVPTATRPPPPARPPPPPSVRPPRENELELLLKQYRRSRIPDSYFDD